MRLFRMVVVALDRAITSLSPVLPPRPALPLLPAPKVSEPKRKSRRERPVRRRVFRARHACVFTLFLSLCRLYTRFIFPLRSLLASSEGLRSVVPRRLLYDRSCRTRRSRRFSSKAAFPSDCTRLLAVVNTRADRSMVFTHWIESRCPDRQVIFAGEE